jgi:hypothetical protein
MEGKEVDFNKIYAKYLNKNEIILAIASNMIIWCAVRANTNTNTNNQQSKKIINLAKYEGEVVAVVVGSSSSSYVVTVVGRVK